MGRARSGDARAVDALLARYAPRVRSLVALRTGMSVIPCPGGTAEAVATLAQLWAEIGAQLAPYDADIDLDGLEARGGQGRLECRRVAKHLDDRELAAVGEAELEVLADCASEVLTGRPGAKTSGGYAEAAGGCTAARAMFSRALLNQ